MRRILLGLFALTLLAAFTAPAYAADMKMSGFFRVRGSAEDNADGNDDAGDTKKYYDALIRPRFTVKTNGGKTMAVWEPEFVSANGGFAIGPNRQTVGVNRWVIDFAVPGTAMRLRIGRTDYGSPDKEIYDTSGRHREPGFALYGKLSNNVSLSAFHTKMEEDTSDNNDDRSDYLVALSAKVSPTLTLSPWLAKSVDQGDGEYDYNYLGVNAKTKLGMVNVNASVVMQDGEVADGTDLSAWALLVRTSTSMGKMKLMGNITMLSGEEDDAIIAAEGEASRTTTSDGEYGGFLMPQLGGSGWVFGGHIMSSRRWTTLSNGIRDVTMGGGGAPYNASVSAIDATTNLATPTQGNVRKMNGTTTLEALGEYKVSKTLTIAGGISYYQSAESAPAVCLDGLTGTANTDGAYSAAAGNGTCDAGEATLTYDDDKHFGTELNLGFRWKLYPNLELRAVAAYLTFGDYGLVEGGDGYDDMWALGWTLRHTF